MAIWFPFHSISEKKHPLWGLTSAALKLNPLHNCFENFELFYLRHMLTKTTLSIKHRIIIFKYFIYFIFFYFIFSGWVHMTYNFPHILSSISQEWRKYNHRDGTISSDTWGLQLRPENWSSPPLGENSPPQNSALFIPQWHQLILMIYIFILFIYLLYLLSLWNIIYLNNKYNIIWNKN